MVLWNYLLVVIWVVAVPSYVSAVTVIKCCPYGEKLDSNLTNCVPLQNETQKTDQNPSYLKNILNDTTTETNKDLVYWLPDILVNNEYYLDIKIRNKMCPRNRTLKLRASQDISRFEVLQNGSLELRIPTAFDKLQRTIIGSSDFCIDAFTSDDGIEDNAFLVCPCERVNCVNKCCKKNFVLVCIGRNCECEKHYNESNWKPIHPDLPLPKNDFAYEVLEDVLAKCPERTVETVANPWAYPEYIMRKYWEYPDGKLFSGVDVCAEEIELLGVLRQGIVRCVTKRPFWGIVDLSYGLHLPEVVLLLLSVFTIFIVPRRRVSVYSYVHDLAMACHAGCLLARGLLWTLHINTETTICPYTPMIIYFTSMAASVWLNVICVNLAYGFWKPLGLQNSRWGGVRGMFVCYSLYAWGLSAVMTALTAAMWYAKDIPPSLIRPTLYETRTCFREGEGQGKIATFVYFYGPIAGLLVFNGLLFLSTAFRVRALRRNTSVLGRKRTTSKEASLHNRRSVMVYIKLLWLMGVLEIAMETAAWASNITEYEFAVAASALDVLRAAAIFVLCCCKKRTLRALRDRLRACCAPLRRICPSAPGVEQVDLPRVSSVSSKTNTDVSVATDVSTCNVD